MCDVADGRAEAAARRFAVPSWETSLDAMLARDDIDAVTIATPIGLHHEHGLLAIRAGKHVHFNKTMAVTCAQATELIDEAAMAGVQLVASPGEVLRPHVREIKRLIADGAIGRLCWAACGAAFGDPSGREPERERPAGVDRPVVVLPLAGRRPPV